MLSLDLFDSKYERRLHEGAVDDLEYRRLNDLREKMEYLMQAYRQTNDPESRAAIKKRYDEYKSERESYLKIREQQQSQTPVKGQDLVTPQQRVTGATPPKTSMLGKARETFSSFANWLAGREDKGPTYETKINENDPNSAINAAKYAYEQMRKAHDDNVDIATIRWMSGGEPVTMSRNQIYHTLLRLKGMSRQNRNAFAVQTLADRTNFYLWLGSQKKITPRPQLKQPVDPMQPELPLGKPKISPVQERSQKKKSDDIQAGDVKVARELQKLRAQYPAARSDVEAVARAEIDSSERSNQQIAAIRGANEKQDALLKQLVALDREQGREIDTLDQENNTLEKQLAQVQATNNRLQQAMGQMTGTKRSFRPQPATKSEPTVAVAPTSADAATLKKVQDLESQIQQLQSQPRTAQNLQKISSLDARLSQLQAQVGQLTPGRSRPESPFSDLDIMDKPVLAKNVAPRPQAPSSDLDVKPAKTSKSKPAKSKAKAIKSTSADDEPDFLNINEPDLFAVQEKRDPLNQRLDRLKVQARREFPQVDSDLEALLLKFLDKEAHDNRQNRQTDARQDAELKRNFALDREQEDEIEDLQSQVGIKEHGGGIGPRQHWQDLMPEGWSDKYNPTPYAVYIDGRQWKIFSSDEHARAVADKVRANLKRQGRDQTVTIAPSQEYLQKKINEEQLVEGIKDTTAATAVIACLLTGGSLSGCATSPQKTTAQQVLKTGQDIGRTVQTAQRITRAGVEAEVNQEIRNLLRGIGGRPEELNNSNILRIWRKIKGAPPVQPEPQAPEYGPAEPVKRPAQFEAKEINTREDFVRERDRLLRMINMETDPANRQILKSAIRQLEGRAENEGWISLQQRMIREDNASKAAEQAIIKRIMVAHTDLLQQYGPEKVVQAAEEVAYNVGDLGEIGSSDVSGWVKQVKQILGATA